MYARIIVSLKGFVLVCAFVTQHYRVLPSFEMQADIHNNNAPRSTRSDSAYRSVKRKEDRDYVSAFASIAGLVHIKAFVNVCPFVSFYYSCLCLMCNTYALATPKNTCKDPLSLSLSLPNDDSLSQVSLTMR